MSFHQLTGAQWQRALSRVLIIGDPNSRKTTSLATFPRPAHVLVMPGEKGAAALPQAADLIAYAWQDDEPKPLSARQTVKAIENEIDAILTEKHGPVTTFAVDGLHKLYYWILADVTDGASVRGEDFEAKLYSRSHEAFMHIINKVALSKAPYVVFTCWEGREADEPGQRSGPSHIFPDLPGKLAKRIMGEFSIVLRADVGQSPNPTQPAPATWQLQPGGKVWGCGVKIPANIAVKLPKTVPQDWAKLEPLLVGATPPSVEQSETPAAQGA